MYRFRVSMLLLLSLAWVSVSLADSAELREIHDMLRAAAFDVGAGAPLPAEETPFRILTAQQDYAQPTADRCCHTLTPIKIGQQSFEKGIGAHANGRIVLELQKPCAQFTAQAGIDNNWDTQGARGSARFSVLVDGQERFHSEVCRGGQEPIPVTVDLAGAHRLELVIDDAGDGIICDQADWADAVVETAEGKRDFIGDHLRAPLFHGIPTSFVYGDQECWGLFEHWAKTSAPPVSMPDGIRYENTWTEPDTGFRATLSITVVNTVPVVELQWQFENTADKPSGVISAVNSLDGCWPARDKQAVLHSCSGGLTGDLEGRNERTGFELSETALGEKNLTVTGGRSSFGDLPFFFLTNTAPGWNLAMALGWSGQWSARGKYDAQQGGAAFQAGMTPVHFRLPAGEKIALPTALIVPFQGDTSTGTNRLRRLLKTHYQAKLNGQPVLPPVSFNSWFTFDNRVNDAMLRELADQSAPLGLEYFCLDAGWFDGDFPNGVGNWTINRTKFPDGLKPLADHVHGLGMKFGLWFEPERVADGTRWQKLYPDLLLKNNLMDLGNAKAREIVLSMLDTTITEVGVDWIRFDFNIDPLGGWESVEGPEEQGLHQIRYINGLYGLLEELMRRHPGLLIEQCSSGGRRIDLRTIQYGHTFWKSDDTMIQPLMRFHEAGANVFLPGGLLNTNYCHYRSQGELLGLFAGPLGFGTDFRALTAEDKAAIAQTVSAYKQIRRFIDEDYYPLFPQSKNEQTWWGHEFIDPVAQEGFFVLFRPETSPYDTATIVLHGLEAQQSYRLRNPIGAEEQTKSGAELAAGLTITVAKGTAQVWSFGR